jgi:hypothetical protein
MARRHRRLEEDRLRRVADLEDLLEGDNDR